MRNDGQQKGNFEIFLKDLHESFFTLSQLTGSRCPFPHIAQKRSQFHHAVAPAAMQQRCVRFRRRGIEPPNSRMIAVTLTRPFKRSIDNLALNSKYSQAMGNRRPGRMQVPSRLEGRNQS